MVYFWRGAEERHGRVHHASYFFWLPVYYGGVPLEQYWVVCKVDVTRVERACGGYSLVDGLVGSVN